MTLLAFRVVCSGTAAQNIGSANSDRYGIKIQNVGSNTLYIGGDASITAGNAYPILQNDVFTDQIYDGAWYAVCSGTLNSTITTLEEEN